MAGNDWVNSYLEAILDAGPGIGDAKSSLLLRERGHFSPTRYFVEEVITGFDETDLHRSWIRTQATRSPQERNTRMENMCWRIWNLARKKKQLEGEEAQRMAKRRLERERGRKEATADMSEDLSEGEKGDLVNDSSLHGNSIKGRIPRISSVDAMETWASQHKEKKLYIVLISLHGLIRGENMELGRDSDTGGQVKYVVELARALGAMPGVYRVDLLTRQVSAADVDFSYGEPTEMLTPRCCDDGMEGSGESSGAYIIRIPFGPVDKYVQKEHLWSHIPEFVDNALSHIIQMSRVLGEQIGGGQPVWPVAIHGHYADAGDAASLLSGALNVPMLFTGHSLGRDKLEQLLKQGRQSREEINATYRITRRIEAEELSLDASEVVITSTRQEIEEQWRLYDGFDPILERKLRARVKRGVYCYGRFMPRMVIIPPGLEFHHIVAHDVDVDGEVEGNEESIASPDPSIWSEVMRFFANPRKPMILALSRPDPKKNITTLVKAFGECRPLRELANLTLIMGNREGIDEMSNTSSSVLLSILKLIDKYDLYGQVAYPKHHKQYEVPEIYRLAAKTKGVFINPAFIEPFGLTLIEATAHGLPIVATKNGGPVDIHRVLENGLLVDPHDERAIADALLKLVADKQLWTRCRHNGLKNIHLFSWPEHCKTYLSRISTFKPRHPQWQGPDELEEPQPHSPGDSLRDIQDISLNLKLSLDLEKKEEETLDSNTTTTTPELEKAVLRLSKGVLVNSKKPDYNNNNNNSIGGKLKRRKKVFVIAMDGCDRSVLDGIQVVMEAVEDKDGIGFVLSTCLGISEVHPLLISAGISHTDFDAFICNSGGDLYYPTTATPCEEDTHVPPLPYLLDIDYHSHIEYRWAGEELRKTLLRWAAGVDEKSGGTEGGDVPVLREDKANSTPRCYTFRMNMSGLSLRGRRVEEVGREMRIQAVRCNVVYCENGRRMNVIPVLASRAQAMRYLYVRWGMELRKTVVFVGEEGDSDYYGIIRGAHKTIILRLQSSSSSSHSEDENNTPPFQNHHLFLCDATASAQASSILRIWLLQLGILIH